MFVHFNNGQHLDIRADMRLTNLVMNRGDPKVSNFDGCGL
jgi:hypothetical protein